MGMEAEDIPKELKELQDNQKTILLSEIGALIHDLGKLNDYFIKKKSIEGSKNSVLSEYRHGDILEYDSDAHNNFYPNDNVLKRKAEKLKKSLEKITVSYNSKSSDLYSFIKYHHNNSTNDFVQLLKTSDSFDSKEDRSNAFDQQSICKTYYSNAFGYEKEVEVDYIKERKAVYDIILDILDTCDVNKIREKRREFMNKLRNSFSKALGMTARAANDVSLWEHSYMTASIMKTLLCQSILENNFPIVKRKEEIEHRKPFRILSIGWDFFDFIQQSHTIPDVIGRMKILKEIKEKIRNLVEIEYLLGNCIYEDDYGLHFLVPAAFDEESIIENKVFEIVNEKTNGILVPCLNLTDKGGRLTKLLPNTIKELEGKIKNREIDFIPKWIESWKNDLPQKKLICSVCGKGFYCEEEKEKICRTCKDIRNKGREEKPPETIFIDEIAWNGRNYENVALVVLNFELENWLNGTFVKSLFIRKYDEKNLQELKDFYNSELCSSNYDINTTFTKKLLDLGALNAWIAGNDRAYNNALTQVKKCIDTFNSSGTFVKSELNNIKIYLDLLKNKLENREKSTVKKIFEEELNRSNIEEQLKAKFRGLEEFLLGSEHLDEKRKTVKNSAVEEIKEKIFLKPPSPSRLMRVWNNTKEFFEDLRKYICEESLPIERYVLMIDKTSKKLDKRAWKVEISVEGKKRTGEIVFDGKDCITVTPHINKFIEDNKNTQLKIKVIDRGEYTENEFSAKFKEKRIVRGYRIISISPNMFMFLVPASKVFNLVIEIKKRYMEQFGKVYGKLPLNVGVVYFKRKTPFFAALDSARRFKEVFKFDKEEGYISGSVNEDYPYLHLRIKVKGKEILWKVNYTLGDGEIDYYHPYILVGEGGIALSDMRVKHVLSLEKGEKIKIYPSYFDFEYLDTTRRRFDIILEKEKRPHRIFGEKGSRPYYMEEINNFKKLWEIFCGNNSQKKKINTSQIQNFESVLISKIEEWGLNDIYFDQKNKKMELFQALIEDSIIGILDIPKMIKKDEQLIKNPDFESIKQSVLSGLFFDVIELYMSIMKRKPEEVSE